MFRCLLFCVVLLPLLCAAQFSNDAYAQPLADYGVLTDSIGVVYMDSTTASGEVVQATLVGWIQVYVKTTSDGTTTKFFFVPKQLGAASTLYSHDAYSQLQPDKPSQRAFSSDMLKFLEQHNVAPKK